MRTALLGPRLSPTVVTPLNSAAIDAIIHPCPAGTAGSNITEYTGSGYAGFEAGAHDNVGGKGGVKVVPARYLVPHPPAFEVEVTHFSTMKGIIQDRMAGLAPGGTHEFPPYRGHVAGYSGFQPRCPPMGVGPQNFVSLSELDKEAAEGA